MMKRKGVEGIIAVVLLLMMTVAIAGAAFIWLTKMQNDMQDDVSKQQEEMKKKASSSLVIDAAWATALNTPTHIMLRNNGQYTYTSGEVDNIEIHYNGIPRGKLVTVFDDNTMARPCVGNALAPGESCEAVSTVLTASFPWIGGAGWEFTIKILEPTTEASISKSCRMSSAGQKTC
ncbi:MAG: hypothetical protein KAQ92_05690 [Candidatus Aenigmarchaeota archaeon]|nr:hypothetical protein [Candidatus Aenigmarchaeota archaeon]